MTTKITREAERQHGLQMAGPFGHLLDAVAHDLHNNESLHLHDCIGPVEHCGYCYLRAGRTLGVIAQHLDVMANVDAVMAEPLLNDWAERYWESRYQPKVSVTIEDYRERVIRRLRSTRGPNAAQDVLVPLDAAWPTHCGEPMWFRGGTAREFYCDCGHHRPPEPNEVRSA